MEADLENVLKEHKVMLENHAEHISCLKEDVKELRTDVTWLKTTYQEIKDTINRRFDKLSITYRNLDTKVWAIVVATLSSLLLLIGILIKSV